MTRKLDFELVPASCWYSNVRALLKDSAWRQVRLKVLARHGHKCYYCGAKPKSLDCHEIWTYTLGEPNVQYLEDIIPLCKACHQVCHIGLWSIKGQFEQVLRHYTKVSGKTREQAIARSNAAFKTFDSRSELEWVTVVEPTLGKYLGK